MASRAPELSTAAGSGSNPTTHDFGCADEIGNNPLERVSVPGGGRKAYRSALIAAQQIWLFNIREGSISTERRCLRNFRFAPDSDRYNRRVQCCSVTLDAASPAASRSSLPSARLVFR